MELTNESKTLFIPLLGKAVISEENIFLCDQKAEEIISKIDYNFEALKQSKWLSMFMSVRAMIIDNLCNKYILENPNAIIIHLGCGLDSRCLRVNQNYSIWFDIDYENVIDIRKRFYDVNSKYRMIGSSVIDFKWLEEIDNCENILIVMEGLTMYLSEKEMEELIKQINIKFDDVHLIFDAYSKIAVKISKFKNPVKQMNAEVKYGIDNPGDFLSLNERLSYIATYFIKKDDNKLPRFKKFIFNNLYCGKVSQSIYRIYEFNLKK